MTRSEPDWHSSCTRSARLARSNLPENPSPESSVRPLERAATMGPAWDIRSNLPEQSPRSDSPWFLRVCRRALARRGPRSTWLGSGALPPDEPRIVTRDVEIWVRVEQSTRIDQLVGFDGSRNHWRELDDVLSLRQGPHDPRG